MKTFIKQLHIRIYVAIVFISFLIFWPLIYFFSRKPHRFNHLNKLRKLLAKWSSALAGFFYKVHNPHQIDLSKQYIVCANHSSNLDISALTILLKSNFFFLGKEELLKSPILGLFFKTIDVPVNRDSKISSFKAFKKVADALADGRTVIIFPEGGIADTYPPVLQTFKNGPFKLAIEKNIPILPISIKNAWQLLWDDGFKYGSKPGTCHIFVHKPVSTVDLADADHEKLKEKLYHLIKSEL